MIKKSVLLVIMTAFMLSLGFAAISMATDAGPEVLTLTTKKAKKPAVFPHKKHQDMMKCDSCHHTKGADGKQAPLAEGAKVEKCETCHNKKDMTNKKLASFKGAAHKNCTGCHKKDKKGPTKCAGCHPKKKKKKAIEGC